MTVRGPSLCDVCKRRTGPGTDPATGIPTGTCEAFPSGIPAVLALGGADHRNPFPGDSEILFAPYDTPGFDEIAADGIKRFDDFVALVGLAAGQ